MTNLILEITEQIKKDATLKSRNHYYCYNSITIGERTTRITKKKKYLFPAIHLVDESFSNDHIIQITKHIKC